MTTANTTCGHTYTQDKGHIKRMSMSNLQAGMGSSSLAGLGFFSQ
jgi:hypothetical protein